MGVQLEKAGFTFLQTDQDISKAKLCQRFAFWWGHSNGGESKGRHVSNHCLILNDQLLHGESGKKETFFLLM